MKYIIRKVIKELEDKEKAYSSFEVYLFKYLDKIKAYNEKSSSLYNITQDALKTLGGDVSNARYYSQLYSVNHLPDGNYRSVTKDQIIDPRLSYPSKTLSRDAREFALSKLPFKASNLKGFWDKDSKGVKYYVIVSYDWYPIYLFKDNHWYQVMDTYSSTTRKQISRVNPVVYDETIGRDVIMVTREEIKDLRYGATYEDIMKRKVQNFIQNTSRFISDKPKTTSTYGENPIKVKFKIDDIKKEDDSIIIYVSVLDVGKKEGRKTISLQGQYLKNETDNINKEKVENEIKKQIFSDIEKYLGTITSKKDIDINSNNTDEIKFVFTHTQENL
jgi:hypothetical protein